jgi:hypothetical protein
MKFRKLETQGDTKGYRAFWCTACGCGHYIDDRWQLDEETLTVSPSVVSRVGDEVCHLFIKNGNIEYLPDYTHPLAGQNVPLEDF